MPLTFYKQPKILHWSTLLDLHCRVRKELSGGINDSGCTFFGNAILPWLKVNVNETTVRNLFLTLEDIVESVAKTIATQQRSLDSLTKVVLDSRRALDYLLPEQGGYLSYGQYHWLYLN